MPDREHQALLELGRALSRQGYRFVTITPASHQRVVQRAERRGDGRAHDLRDVFGWNLPFDARLLGAELAELLRASGRWVETPRGLRSTVRFSTIGARLFVHSGFPTDHEDAVFFGPDTYRFVDFIERAAPRARRLVDVGCGSGAGGIVLAERAATVVLADINEQAIAFARINAALAGVTAELHEGDVLAGVDGDIDLVTANPPYMIDGHARTYRNGGGEHGEGLAARIVRESVARLAAGGTLLVYTGAPIVGGVDVFLRAVEPVLAAADARLAYREIDPDVFGEELDTPGYADVERIAVVGLIATVPPTAGAGR
ncbi:MAG TPA: class I SAM-dependent methyltransferase [Nannocystaceae bacterium]|nr:class I SAM-dependent methyltransferase [Nannocystaceae bacterium]